MTDDHTKDELAIELLRSIEKLVPNGPITGAMTFLPREHGKVWSLEQHNEAFERAIFRGWLVPVPGANTISSLTHGRLPALAVLP